MENLNYVKAVLVVIVLLNLIYASIKSDGIEGQLRDIKLALVGIGFAVLAQIA